MAIELALRFFLGGLIVSLFAVAGDLFKPKTFAGLFGAAPSVALTTLAIAYATKGSPYVAVEARSMVLGSVAFFVYGLVCVAATRSERAPVWVGAALAWGAWGAVAFSLWALLLRGAGA